ncbi:hypothetical protein Vadar_022102 [Vaccinium darrowii]|uniref:Uncharacterized protein n=1 Tax=Vaccinium darrowii TaxID=229202 RepID=A0ACB7YNH1_9ERIC|nr:hypothetical protein Vadar_022102 [Vaccinium darrowii]
MSHDITGQSLIRNGLGRGKFWAKVNGFHDFLLANTKPTGEPRQHEVEKPIRWSLPVHGFLKINSDGAFDATRKGGGVGLVARNLVGQVKWIAAIPISNVQSAKIVEALGFRWAMAMAKDRGEHLSFEGDAQCVIQMLQGVRVANQ